MEKTQNGHQGRGHNSANPNSEKHQSSGGRAGSAITKRLKVLLLILFALIASMPVVIWAIVPSFKLDRNTSVEINVSDIGGTNCMEIVNSSGSKDYFIPTKTSNEWAALVSSPPIDLVITNCATDGYCGDGICGNALDDDISSCGQDCGGICGDGICSVDIESECPGEDPGCCVVDCGYCGDGYCQFSGSSEENCKNCSGDCGACTACEDNSDCSVDFPYCQPAGVDEGACYLQLPHPSCSVYEGDDCVEAYITQNTCVNNRTGSYLCPSGYVTERWCHWNPDPGYCTW